MRNSALVPLLLLILSLSFIAQKKDGAAFKPDTIELITPWDFSGRTPKPSEARRLKSCFNFILMDYGCGRAPNVAYGDRIGINWDVFQIAGGKFDRTRMVEIGKFNWNDKFTVPHVEPWPALSPGENRTINVNVSGGDGAPGQRGEDGVDGVAGMNGDGTYTPMRRVKTSDVSPQPILQAGKSYATAKVKEQVSSTVRDSTGKIRSDPYSPMLEVKKGYMYVVRVVDESRDFYVLIHVDDLVRGERVVLSYWKLEIIDL